MNFKRKVILPAVILCSAAAISVIFIKSGRQKIPKQEKMQGPPVVKVESPRMLDYQIVVEGHGTTRPRFELPVASPVGGQVVWVDPGLVAGGRFKKGDILFKLDPTDYLVAWEEARFQLASAEYDLRLAMANQSSALSSRSLSEKSHSGESSDFSTLARHEPQMKKARALLQLAQARLKQAKSNLERTNVTAPFSGFISEAGISVGQILNRGQETAKLLNNDTLLVDVAISLDEYQWLHGSLQNQTEYPKASLIRVVDGKTHVWYGQVIQMLPGLNPAEKQITLLIEISQPVSGHQLRMPTGLFVKANIQGQTLRQVWHLPSEALRGEDNIWVMNPEGLIMVQKIDLLHQAEGIFFRAPELKEEDQVITSPATGLVPGMQVQSTASAGSGKEIL